MKKKYERRKNEVKYEELLSTVDMVLSAFTSVLLCAVFIVALNIKVKAPKTTVSENVIPELKTAEVSMVTEQVEEPVEIEGDITVEEPSDIQELPLTKEEIELIALVTMAEAEGECEEGKRLVIDTILNRVDLDPWPDTVNEVVYQQNQFTSMWNGRVDRCYVDEAICQLVREELISRTNYEVVFFTAGGYGRYGTPLFQVGNHYFCKI